MWTVENANNVLTSAQCRAARTLLGLSQSRLAALARCSHGTVENFEAGRHVCHIRIRHGIRQVLESLGAEFEAGEVRDRRKIAAPRERPLPEL